MKTGKFTIILLISVFLALTILAGTVFFGKQFLLNKVKASIIETVESSTPFGIKIGSVGFTPFRGIHLKDVSLYKNALYEKEIFSAPHLYVKFPLTKYLFGKIFSPTIAIYDLKAENLTLNGLVGFELKKGALKKASLNGLSAKTAFLNIENINGAISFAPELIESSSLKFTLNGEPCQLNFKIQNPTGEFSSELGISSPNINITSAVKKEEEIYKIQKIEGKILNSSFGFVGEVENLNPLLVSLYGNAAIDVKDVVYFTPQPLKERLASLNPEGSLDSSVYFKGNIMRPLEWELGIKSTADSLKARYLNLRALRVDTRLKDGSLAIPLFNAYIYGGALSSQAVFDLKNEDIPYRIDCKLSNVDVREIAENTALKGRNIKGVLFSEFSIRGSAKNINSAEGPGRIVIREANLGPMPLLAPLLGNIYGYFQHVFPELKKVEIKDVSCDFYVAQRKISSNNILLLGDMISIEGKGYMDFGGNLNFDVENQLRAAERGEENWQSNFQKLIVQFGKLISKARLRGTLQKPKWEFEYFSGMQNMFKGGIEKLFKDILE